MHESTSLPDMQGYRRGEGWQAAWLSCLIASPSHAGHISTASPLALGKGTRFASIYHETISLCVC